ncbi:MAG: tetratricopeptide repeat protein [Armatimonadota bacterium]
MSSQKQKKQKIAEPEQLEEAQGRSRTGLIVCLVLLVLAAAIPYMFSLGGELMMDDKDLICTDKTAHSLLNIPKAFTLHFFGSSMKSNYYRPIVTVSYIINYAMSGQSPTAYRITNLLFHIIAVLLVFVLGRRLMKNTRAALLAGLIFAVHPAHTESVAWIAGRTDILAAIFALSALIAYDKYLAGGNRRWYIAAAVLFLTGLLSKEVVIVVPLMMFVLDSFFRKRSGRSAVVRVIPFLAIAAAYFVVRRLVLGHVIIMGMNTDLPLWYRICIAPTAMMWYLKILFVPQIAQPLHDFIQYTFASFALVAAGWAVIAGLLIYALSGKRRSGIVSFCIIWMILALLPVSNIIRLPWPFLCERFLYLPSVGFSFLFGLLFSRILSVRPKPLADVWPLLSAASVAGVLLYCALQTYGGAPLWSNNRALVTRMLQLGPRFGIIHLYAGDTYSEAGDFKRAASEYESVIKNDRKDEASRAKLAVAYSRLGDFRSESRVLKELLKLRPNDAVAYNDLGIALASMKDYTAAVKSFRKAVQLKPNNARIRFNLARALARNKDTKEALLEYENGLKINPKNKKARKEFELLKGRQ